MRIRNCNRSDVAAMRSFIQNLSPLDLHSAFTYWTIFEYFGDLCFLAEMETTGQILGIVTGIVSSVKRDTCYLWQLGVNPTFRRTSCAYQLIECLVDAARRKGCNALQFSIEPSNKLSFNTANRFAERRGLSLSVVGKVEFYDPAYKKNTHETL